MNEAEVKKIVAETVKQTLLTMGVDTDDPIELQRDLQHLRDWRLSVAAIKRQGLLTAVGVIMVGVLGLIWMAISGRP